MIILIAAVARNGVIGADGKLPWAIPADMQRFKATTMGHPVIMGRTTFQSIGRPLRGRTNIVLTRRRRFAPGGVAVARDIDAALAIAAARHPGSDVYVIGGAAVYEAFLPLAGRLELTLVDAEPSGDAWFPRWEPHHWRRAATEAHDGDPPFRFETWTRMSAPSPPITGTWPLPHTPAPISTTAEG